MPRRKWKQEDLYRASNASGLKKTYTKQKMERVKMLKFILKFILAVTFNTRGKLLFFSYILSFLFFFDKLIPQGLSLSSMI